MTNAELTAKLAELESRILYLEQQQQPFPFGTWKEYPPTQGCSQEEQTICWSGASELSKSKHKTWKAKAEDIDPTLMTPSYHCTYEHP